MDLIKKISSLDDEKRKQLSEKLKCSGKEYGVYPLTQSQLIFWKKYQLRQPVLLIGNLRFIIGLSPITLQEVKRIIKELRNLHDVCRYKFFEIEGSAFQFIDNESEPHIPEYIVEQDSKEQLKECYSDFFNRSFDLENDFPINFGIVNKGENSYQLMIRMHHIVADGFSVGVVNRDIHNILNGTAVKSEVQFADYVERINEKAADDTAYWINELRDADKRLDAPSDHGRYDLDRDDSEAYCLSAFDSEINEKIRNFVKVHKHNFFNITSSLFSLILQKWTGKSNITMASTFFNRDDDKSFNIIGNFSSFLPLVYRYRGDLTVQEYIEGNTAKFKEGIRHSNIVNLDLQNSYPYDCCSMYFPMYQVIFAYHSKHLYSGIGDSANGVNVELIDYNFDKMFEHSIPDILVRIDELDDSYSIIITYNKRLFNKETIENISGIFKGLVSDIDKIYRCRLDELSLADYIEQNYPDDINTELFKNYEPENADTDININDRYCVNCGGQTKLCILDCEMHPVPKNFMGSIYINNGSGWSDTGKTGRITLNDVLEIDDTRSAVIRYRGKNINIKKALNRIKTKYGDIYVRFDLYGDFLILNHNMCDTELNVKDIFDITGIAPDFVQGSFRMNQRSFKVRQSKIANAVKMLSDNGAMCAVDQADDNINIHITGSNKPDDSLILKIYDENPDDRIRFIYSGNDEPNGYEYAHTEYTEMEKLILSIWQNTVGNNISIYDDFYEYGLGKIYDFILRYNSELKADLDIMTLFRYPNIHRLAAYTEGCVK